MNLFTKKTLGNFWFWVCVGILVSIAVMQMVLELCMDREVAPVEYASRCPDGFVSWENSEF